MKTLRDFIQKSIKTHGDNYDYSLSVYTGCEKKLKIICKKCNYIFEQEPRHHMNGSGCPKCSNKYKPTTEEFIQESISIHGDNYLYDKTEYKSNDEHLIITCKIHGDFIQKPVNHINRKQGCPKCKQNYKSNTENFIKKSKEIFKNRLDYESVQYINWKSKVKLFCKKHNYFFSVTPNAHLSKKQGCPKCKMSLGEFKIINILENNNIEYYYQKTFSKCKNIKQLPFDFYLPKQNICIEFDGKQHFEPIEKFGGEKYLNYIMINDKIKNDFCEKHNIILLRIHYSNNTYEKITELFKINNII